ncbi:hypothetical protein GJAV_G00082510 [Gymnothorax javanicus]|nr:hypothetical protein GJAV_G00082510 [Gymnothorax javanicus]
MCLIKVLFIILLGTNGFQVVKTYSNGNVYPACESMMPQHPPFLPQNTPNPYEIIVKNISLDKVIVILKATSEPFRGFLLEAEDSQGRRPFGTFTLVDPKQTQILNCDGNTASAVSHRRNDDKREISVNWTRPTEENYTFRATFVRRYNTFWVAELRDPISTTSPTSTTSAGTVTSNELPAATQITDVSASTSASTTSAATVPSKPPATNSTNAVSNTTSLSTTTVGIVKSKAPATTLTTDIIYITVVTTTTSSAVTSKPPATTSTTAVINTNVAAATTANTVTSKPPATTSTSAVGNTTSESTTTAGYVTSKAPAATLTTYVVEDHISSSSLRSTATVLVTLAVPFMYGSQTKMVFSSYGGFWFPVHVLFMSLFACGNIIALILVFIEGWRTEAHTAVVCVVTVLTIIQIVLTFFRCGKSHELRFIFNWFHRLNALAIVCLTVAAVFTGLADIEAASPQQMLQELMGGLVAWEFLFFILQLSLYCLRKRGKDDWSHKMKKIHSVIQMTLLVVFSLGNAALLVALLERIFAS